jgi:hypothetical protein
MRFYDDGVAGRDASRAHLWLIAPCFGLALRSRSSRWRERQWRRAGAFENKSDID